MSMSSGLSSPTFTSVSTTSSFDMVSPRSRSSSTMSSQSFVLSEDDDSDDEIVWSVASSGILSQSDISTESSLFPLSEGDFVLLDPPGTLDTHSGLSTPSAVVSQASDDTSSISLSSDFAGLSLTATTPKRKAKASKRKKKRNPPAVTSTAASPAPPERPSSASTPTPRSKRRRSRLGARPIGVSERGDEVSVPSLYDDAVRYITSFLTNPTAKETVCHLRLLQSLIIELGLTTSSIPTSLTSAKTLIKSQAFVNIRDYLALRGQGLSAVQRAMHPSRSALRKDIKRKGNPASLKWVKQNGLQVLLVSCYP
ncbi:uncharacterized protein EV420DRAFT_1536691 [Desarmillaria tabescens]|uniref:Uncharacterized protein n=1 Tax=Armillaria tabescens TaxID=1929756 RepID=A0AA39KEN1_ARMTA|nr:uncharacterized protein EV420DRAFT_1536691 [Desarmillaria tabescens]KAK0459582.1 hypothetical protein EV420DRAFT_1536691 [Desarmillaria tabescens]